MKLGGALKIGEGTSNTHQAFWVVLGSLSSMSLGIISSAILSRYFPKEEYGTYRQIIYVYTTLLVIFTAGLPDVFGYFLPRYSINEGKNIVWKITKVLFLGGGAFSVVLFTSSGLIAMILNNPELAYGLKVFSPIPMLLLPTLGLEGIFSTYKKTIFIGIYNTITRVLMLLFIVLPVILFHGNYIDAIYGWLVVSVISLFIAFYFKRIPFKKVVTVKSSLKYREVFTYSVPLVTAAIWGIAMRSADQFYISRYFGPKTFAIFSNGFMQLPLVSMVTSAASIVLMPVFSKILHEKKDLKELLSIWRSALFKSAIIIYPIVIFFIFFAKDVIIILFSRAYVSSAIYFRINMVVNFFNIIVFAPLLLSMGKTKFYSRIHMIFAIAVWTIEYIAILTFQSPIAVAVVSVSLNILIVIACMIYVSKVLRVGIFELIPFRLILKIIGHVLVITLLVKFGIDMVKINSALVELALSFCIFISILLITSKIVNLNYLEFIKPILYKNRLIASINKKIRNTMIGKIY